MQDPYIPSPFLVGLPTCPLVAHSRGAARIDITTSLWMSFFDGGAQGKRKQCQPPLTEILYLPTGDSVRYKARVWIDAIGPRVFGCLGSSALYFTTRGDLRLLVLVWLFSGFAFVRISRKMGEHFRTGDGETIGGKLRWPEMTSPPDKYIKCCIAIRSRAPPVILLYV